MFGISPHIKKFSRAAYTNVERTDNDFYEGESSTDSCRACFIYITDSTAISKEWVYVKSYWLTLPD